MAYAENFHGGGFIQWHMVIICIWCVLFVTSQFDVICFQTNVLAKFVNTICIFVYTHSPYFMCYCSEYKLSALQVAISEENELNATTQQFMTAKLPGCTLKQGIKRTHHCDRAIYNCKMRLSSCLVEYEESSIESVRLDWLAAWHTPRFAR